MWVAGLARRGGDAREAAVRFDVIVCIEKQTVAGMVPRIVFTRIISFSHVSEFLCQQVRRCVRGHLGWL